jgi:diacylglycerol kinase family enzyme
MDIPFEPVFTSCPERTAELAASSLKDGFHGLAVYGGDGTLSTAASALCSMDRPPVLAQIPSGSGNDWIRSIGIPQSLSGALRLIKEGCTRRVDTGICLADGEPRFFLNSAGLGFDAYVLRRTLALRRVLPLGKSGYLISLGASAVSPPVWRALLSSRETELLSGEYFTLTLGVGRYSGGGMSLSPSAVPDDGLLDAVWILPVGFRTIAANISRVFDGTLMEMPQARSHRAETFRVEPRGEVLMELDGEFQTFPSPPAEIVFRTGPGLTVIAPGKPECSTVPRGCAPGTPRPSREAFPGG